MPALNANARALQSCVILTAILAMVFAIWPGLDLWFTGLFYDPEYGFWLAHIEFVKHLREFIWKLIILTFLLAFGALVFTKTFRSTTPVLNKVWEVATLTYVLGPMLLVDVILKSHSGRARPSTVEEFGGNLTFSRAFEISDQCEKNCSFVSGEGSGVTALLITVLLVVRNSAPARYTRFVTLAAFAVTAAGLSLRVVMGRHFLSDTVFAVLFVTMIALGLLQLKRYRTLKLF
ncbi:membrane-associated PAP2 superfamily phosphatase [Shimia isoporae]|uniref:Membrane-associated PAP2 superfamily phosphatase n=1 Tax=Shimia isoporae TaxID=647720 RepID=A0A4R1N2J9_9RHOB|nr:phosphatase PAP2 family protein [Shimia isoporae]TCL00611.1 membrane-associated PAP2 superfamily phosphatase [Shimia isoporae]